MQKLSREKSMKLVNYILLPVFYCNKLNNPCAIKNHQIVFWPILTYVIFFVLI